MDPKVPGQSVNHTEFPSLRHPVSTEYQRLQFQGGGVDPVPSRSSLAQSTGGGLDRPMLGANGAHSRDLPSVDCGNAQHPPTPAGPSVAFAHPLDSGSAHDPQPIDCSWLLCSSSGGCEHCAITQSVQVARIAQISILLGYRPPLPSGTGIWAGAGGWEWG